MTLLNEEALGDLVAGSGSLLKKNSVSWILECPRCGKPKLYMYQRTGRFVCWHCRDDGFEGRPEYALSELTGRPVRELREQLYGASVPVGVTHLSVEIRDFFGDGDVVDPEAVEHVRVAWPVDSHPIDSAYSRRGAEYLEGRGVPLALAVEYGVRYHPPKQRVLFPIASRGVLYGWQARLIVSNEYVDEEGETHEVPKVLTPTGVRKDRLLMFADRLEGSEHAVLCEGPVDGLKAHLCGGNVVSMGKGVSRAQVELLRCSGVSKLYLALDPDAAAEISSLAREFADLELYDMRAPAPHKDLGEMSLEEVRLLWESAPRLSPAHLLVYVERDPHRLLKARASVARVLARRGARGRRR